jgi:hypothetical protein
MDLGIHQITRLEEGLSIELNDENMMKMMTRGAKYFEPTPEWDRSGISYDKLWI